MIHSKIEHILLLQIFTQYSAYDENGKTIKIEPSNKKGFNALYPSVLLLRLSLNDLQNLNGLEFNWLPDENIPELKDLNY